MTEEEVIVFRDIALKQADVMKSQAETIDVLTKLVQSYGEQMDKYLKIIGVLRVKD